MLELNRAYNMDCMEGMAQFPDKYFEWAIVDPPYGDAGRTFLRADASRFGGRFDKYKDAGQTGQIVGRSVTRMEPGLRSTSRIPIARLNAEAADMPRNTAGILFHGMLPRTMNISMNCSGYRKIRSFGAATILACLRTAAF